MLNFEPLLGQKCRSWGHAFYICTINSSHWVSVYSNVTNCNIVVFDKKILNMFSIYFYVKLLTHITKGVPNDVCQKYPYNISVYMLNFEHHLGPSFGPLVTIYKICYLHYKYVKLLYEIFAFLAQLFFKKSL